ncbi:MAG TPA: hypothetical protein VGU73_07210 [Acidimicrobiia bacterium]|nr:hypothetical protein [Acidimicrobiia bacterium]
MRRLWIPGRDAGRNLDLFFTFAVAGVLGNRIFLVITGYPQLGNGTLHISHAIWGGVMMLIALVVAISSLAPGARLFVAILGGAGFGWFVDELGKYITRDVDYFFKPTLALIYSIFVLMYFGFRGLRRTRDATDAAILNGIEVLREGLLGPLEEPRRAEAVSMLEVLDEGHAGTHLQTVLLELETVPETEPRLLARVARSIRDWVDSWAGSSGFALTFAGLFVLLAANDAAAVTDEGLYGVGVHTVSEWAITVSVVFSFALALIGLAWMFRSRHVAYRWLEASILVSILITQVFLFHEAQIEATIDLFVTLVFWFLLRTAMAVEETRVPEPADLLPA